MIRMIMLFAAVGLDFIQKHTHTANAEVRMQEMCTGVSIGFGNPDNNSSYVHPSDGEII